MRTSPPSSRPSPRPSPRPSRLTAALALAGALVLAPVATAVAETTAPPASGSGTSTGTPGPGLGAPHPCAPAVAYSLGGPTPPARPLPVPASSVGGDRLAAGGLQVTSSARTPPPAPRATAWLVADLGTGQVLAACNAHVPLAPASSLKVLTALALAPRLAPEARYTARPADAAVDGTKVGMVPGSVYTARDLWHALLMSSANDAATGLAAMAGGTAAATGAMDATARALGAEDTTARNTSGLDEPGQVSSAYDLALFGRAALADPVITSYFTSRAYRFPGPGTTVGAPGRTSFEIQNHNRLLFNYPGALGVKNGWTSTTGGSFVGAAERGGRRVVVTVLAADPQTWRMSAALLDWAFAATPGNAEGVGRLAGGTGTVKALATGAAAASGGPVDAGSAPGDGTAAGAVAAVSADAGTGLTGGEAVALAVGTAALLAAAALGGRSLRTARAGPRPDAGHVPVDDAWRRRQSR